MAIRIEITDLHNEDTDTLIKLGKFLLEIRHFDESSCALKSGEYVKNSDFPKLSKAIRDHVNEHGTSDVPFNLPTSRIKNPDSLIGKDQVKVDWNKSAVPICPPPPPLIQDEEELDARLSNTVAFPKLPWDKRIHSKNKSVNADGTFKLARGVDPQLVREVTDELKQIMSIPISSAIAPPPPPAVLETEESMDFPSLMIKITSLISAKKITREQINAIVQSVGLPQLINVAQRPDLIPDIVTLIDIEVSH